MRAIQLREGVSAVALRFLVLTASRSGAVRLATWDEIDFEAKIWICPAKHMKAGREHRVPLSSGAMAILESIRPENPEGLIFKGRTGDGPLSDMSLTKLIRDLPGSWTDPKQGDALIVPHGFRSSFRDWGSEVAGADYHTLESALAHIQANATVRSYARTDHLDARRNLMEQWAQFALA
jgi:integrase